jgi:1,4-alpha-glucan branching enzyme
MTGYVAIVLHAHLPWVRHPEHARPLEERWLHEALWEAYLPLLDVLDRLAADGIAARITVSVSPTLAAMFADPLLRTRFTEHLDRLDRLAAREALRTSTDAAITPIVEFYRRRIEGVRAAWERIGGDVLGALVRHAEAGSIELATTSVSHAYLPALARSSARAQIKLGLRAFEAFTGRRPAGLWLPECAYDPSIAGELAGARVGYTVLDTHGLELGAPRPPHGSFAPILSPSGVAFFGRDRRASREVWSREAGYPGGPDYRDFYRDIGFDLPEDALDGETGPHGARVMTGLKYHRITGPTAQKAPWDPARAEAQARLDAEHFVAERAASLHARAGQRPSPIVVAPYDAELFGHWWFEGPWFLEHALRALDRSRLAGEIAPITLGGYLAVEPRLVVAEPAASSWGEGGFGEAWLGRALDPSRSGDMSPAHLVRHVRHAEETVSRAVRARRSADGLAGRALDQAIRELLLLEASDWGFMIRRGDMAEYATARVRAHASRVDRLCRLAGRGWIGANEARWIEATCERTPFLAELAGERLRDAFDPWM